MNPGELDRRITVQAYSETRDANGGVVPVWTDTSPRIWAKRVDRGGREFRTSNQLSAATGSVFTIRALPSLTTKHRFVDAGTTFDLLDVQPANRSGFQTVAAVAVNQS